MTLSLRVTGAALGRSNFFNGSGNSTEEGMEYRNDYLPGYIGLWQSRDHDITRSSKYKIRPPRYCAMDFISNVRYTGFEPVTSALSRQRSKPTELISRGSLLKRDCNIGKLSGSTHFILHNIQGTINCNTLVIRPPIRNIQVPAYMPNHERSANPFIYKLRLGHLQDAAAVRRYGKYEHQGGNIFK